MKFRSTVRRAAGVAVLCALLASCGGSSNGLVAFVPARILAFGDEASVITASGRKYTVNALNADGSIDCVNDPIWIQALASSYGMVFPQCVGASTDPNPASLILAQPGATAAGTSDADLAQQITLQLQQPVSDGGGISSNDLVTVYIGVNDVVAAFLSYQAGASTSDAQAQAEQAGVAIATQLMRIADAGGKVIVATVPDVGATPFARSLDAISAAELTYLTGRVNNQMLLTLSNAGYNDGRKIGLIEINTYLLSVVANPLTYGYVDVTGAACVPLDPLLCTTDTLQTNPDGTSAGAFTWLWASQLQLSPGGHRQLGNVASSRAHNQPF
jgi:outer membrane lipase/esterase